MNATAQNQIEILSKWLCRVTAEKHTFRKKKKKTKIILTASFAK